MVLQTEHHCQSESFMTIPTFPSHCPCFQLAPGWYKTLNIAILLEVIQGPVETETMQSLIKEFCHFKLLSKVSINSNVTAVQYILDHDILKAYLEWSAGPRLI